MYCRLCEEFEQGFTEFNGQEIGDRILYNKNNILVFPTLGSFVPGYLLISPREHYISIGETPPPLYHNLKQTQDLVRKILTETYGQAPLFFEHGPISQTKRAGCCIDHTHLHAVPVSLDIFSQLSDKFDFKEISGYDKLKELFNKGIPYFYLQDNDGKEFCFIVPEVVPTQYIRRVIASGLEIKEWDWRQYPFLDNIKETISRLKNKFQEK